MTLRLLIESNFNVVSERSTANEITIVCPLPSCGDQSGNRQINLDQKVTNCWRCNTGGNLFKWARHHGISLEGEADLVQELNELKLETPKLVVPIVSDLDLPIGFTPIRKTPQNAYEKWIGKMARRKNLDYEDFVRAGVGYTRKDPVWEPYAIFPVKEWGKTVYYQGRTYNEDPGQPTKRFPKRKEGDFGSRHWVYNIDRLRDEGGIAVVVESILNVLSLEREFKRRKIKGVVPVAIFKHAISREQRVKIMRCRGLTELCVMFDPDALKSAQKIAINTECIPATVAILKGDADPNDDAEAAVEAFLRRPKKVGAGDRLVELFRR